MSMGLTPDRPTPIEDASHLLKQRRRPTPSAELVRAVLNYDPDTGIFTRKVTTPARKAGVVAGFVRPSGYREISVGGRQEKAHRLAWLHTHGEWPTSEIDHINGDRDDNRIANLRVVTRSGNTQNIRQTKAAGPVGTSWHTSTKKWQASIHAEGRSIYLGLFDTSEEARAAYLVAKRRYHPLAPCDGAA